jgi:magnesium transporter
VQTRLSIREHRLEPTSDVDAPIQLYLASDDSERKAVAEALQLDEYDLASVFDPDEVPRLEVHGRRLFLLWKVPARAEVSEAIHLGVQTVGIVIEADRAHFVTGAGTFPVSARELRHVEGPTDVVLGFLLHSVHHYVGHLRVIKTLSTELEKKITVSMENKNLLQMFGLSESLVYYLDAIEGNAAVLAKMRGLMSVLGATPRQQQMLEDITLENQQAARQANIYSSVLSGLMDARGTIVNNNMNVQLKNLTLINIVFLPLNLIASIGGMSEWTMMTRGIDWWVSYALLVLGMGLLGWFTWVLMKRLDGRAR